MKTLSTLKKDMDFNGSFSSIVEVLKNIAVSQFRALEKKIKSQAEFLSVINSFFEFLDSENLEHPFLRPKEKKQVVVAVTSDSGLLGSLNRYVINAAIKEIESMPSRLVVVGERGKLYAKETGIPFVAFPGITDDKRYYQAMQLRDYLTNRIGKESIFYLKVVYPRPVSFTVQRIEIASLLPYTPKDKRRSGQAAGPLDIIVESMPEDIFSYLVYLLIGHNLYEIFGLSRLAEFAARFAHLEESSERLKEAQTKLRLQYFRVRHELVDRNMRELFSARLLFAGKHPQ